MLLFHLLLAVLARPKVKIGTLMPHLFRQTSYAPWLAKLVVETNRVFTLPGATYDADGRLNEFEIDLVERDCRFSPMQATRWVTDSVEQLRGNREPSTATVPYEDLKGGLQEWEHAKLSAAAG